MLERVVIYNNFNSANQKNIFMRNFLKFTLASCLGVILASFVVFGISALVIGRIVSKADSPTKVKANTVLTLKFDKVIPEKTNNIPISPFDFNSAKVIGLHDIIDAIEYAKTDDNIKGIYLNLSGMQTGRATAASLRDALLDFKSDGKFITAYSKYYTQGSYYIATAADKIYVNPIGGLDFRGFGAAIPFFKDMLDRLGIKMQVYYAGDFKSATEPFRLKKMSDNNRLQMHEYIGSMYKLYLRDISDSRKISVEELKKIADEYLIRNSEDALEYKMVDVIGYEDEAHGELRERLGLEEKDKIPTIGITAYQKGNHTKTDFKIKDKIAVVYAEGGIVDGDGESGSIGGDKYVKILRKIRKDDKIKAVVMRINSGGGSALASDLMWRELELIKAAGKPVIASMGDVAASGGYYIACNADSIFAEPNTITGSIGVFSMIPSLEKMMDEKIGITFDTVKTGNFAIGINPFIDISEEEGKILQESTEEFYEIFLKRVADGRGITRDEAHKVAQGRVWPGLKAQNLNLVDAMGGLEEALAAAADRAGIEKYRVSEYPITKDPLEQLMDEIIGKKETKFNGQAVVKEQLGDLFPYYKYLKEVKEMKGVQARIPFILDGF